MRQKISLTVNGERIEALVEPRTHLADFLREHCNLTGTHLGCEHGVCGACTLLLDDAPVRSCITYAVACDEASVRPVEGYGDDPLMARLRRAFSEAHALQCGFCTPGMLATAYDIIRRLPSAEESEIRRLLSGNLCRCTGYMGITAAIRQVMAEAPAATPLPREEPPPPLRAKVAAAPLAEPPPATVFTADEAPPPGWTRISDSFTLSHPPAESWRLFGDLPAVAACMPGALLEASDGNRLRGRFRVKLGPIGASFAGEAELLRDDARRIGQITGGGKDAQSGSQANGRVIYRLTPAENGAATHVAVTLDFRLQGMLAQFGRSGLVRDLITRTTAEFARNLATLGAPAEGGAAMTAPPRPTAALDAGSLLGAVFWGRLKRWLQRWRGHRD